MNVSIIGVGAMGGAIAAGLLHCSFPKDALTLSNPSQKVLEPFADKGVRVTNSNTEAAASADVVMVVVKPWLVEQVIKEIKPVIDYTRQSLVVVAAGISSGNLTQWLDKNGSLPQIFLGMPNTAIALGESMTFIVPVNANPETTDKVKQLFDLTGTCLVIDEAHLPAATTLASCGIAYAMRYIRASVEGGVELGFKAPLAQEIVVQTVKGAAALLSIPGSHPESEIDKVTTPGGLTIRGLNEMEHAGFTSAVIRGLKAGIKS